MESKWHLNPWSIGMNNSPIRLASRYLDPNPFGAYVTDGAPAGYFGIFQTGAGTLGWGAWTFWPVHPLYPKFPYGQPVEPDGPP